MIELSELTRVGPPLLLVGALVMCAAGWWCQFVRYPAFRVWSADEFRQRHATHTWQISVFVVPGLILQIAGGLILEVSPAAWWLRALNGVCLLGSLLPTFAVSGPIHGKLAHGKDDALIERLLRTNLLRTLFWTGQGVVALLWLLGQ